VAPASVPADAAATAFPETTRHAPPNATQVVRLARYQLRDYFLSRRFILMMAIVAVIGAIFTAVVGYYRPAGLLTDSSTYYGTFWTNGVTVVILFAAVIFGGDAIAGEFQNRTGYFLMGLPIRRATVYAGKYIAAFLAALTAVVVFAVILLANAAYYFGGGAVSGAFATSFVISVVYLFAVLGTTFFFSSLFKTSTYATLVVAVLFLFGFSILQTLIVVLVQVEPWFLISYASATISYPFDPTIPAHVMSGGGFAGPGFTTYNPTYAEGIGIMVGYFLLTALVGLVLFEREEFS
jgi:ABC-2 type transport system permease protein